MIMFVNTCNFSDFKGTLKEKKRNFYLDFVEQQQFILAKDERQVLKHFHILILV